VRVVIFGAGAIGSLVGGLLSKEHDVCLIGREWHISAIRRNGLKISGMTDGVFRMEGLSSLSRYEGKPDIVFLTTKSYDTEYAAKEIARYLGDVPVLSFQNGLNNLEILKTHIEPEYLHAGITTHGVILRGPGQIEHTGTGWTVVGSFTPHGDETLIKEVSTSLTSAGIRTKISPDILTDIWKKGVVNAGINPVTAVARVPNGHILVSPELKGCAIALSTEAESVASALGFRVKNGVDEMLKVANLTAHNRSSMLQDIERKKRTEIDAITGVIVKEGKTLGLPVQYSEVFLSLVKGIERTFSISR